MMHKARRLITAIVERARGFTLVELLITVVIIAILTAIAVPAYIFVVANAQDSAAKQQLSSVRSAQQIHQTTKSVFVGGAQLASSGLLKVPATVSVAASSAGDCFTAMSLSDSKKMFWVDSWTPSPTLYSPGVSVSDCVPLGGMATDLNPAAPNAQSDFTWTTASGFATVTGYTGTRADVVIPDTFTNGAGSYPLRTIKNSSFTGNTVIKTVVIPEGVKTVGFDAFSYTNLTSVVLPESLTGIQSSAFRGAKLSTVSIPDSVTYIDYGAFRDNALTAVKLPAGLTVVADQTFMGNLLTSVDIPQTVARIGISAFSTNDLTGVTLPSGLTILDQNSFFRNEITSIVLPNGLTTLALASFGDNLISTVVIPPSVAVVGSYAFSNNPVTSLTIPAGVTTIGSYAFQSSMLTAVTFPSSVTSIGAEAFRSSTLANAYFEGGAPATFTTKGTSGSLGSAATVRHRSGATGFTSPTWFGYTTAVY
ncbi:leucine-rich repeat protein [Marisediminicola antarctica]|nr:leucine-rich repeat protein [Marisediminicola antarctica]